MKEAPLISVITVTFNAEKVIEKTLLSLKNQTYTAFEHLVIDGASSDQTLSIINRSNLPQTRIISEPDQGLYDAMNKGIKKANGEFLVFLNAGDALHDSTTLQAYATKACQGADIIYGDTIIVDAEGKKLGGRHLSVPPKLTKKSFANGMLICHQAFMVRKNLAPQYNTKYRFSADYDWCVKCIDNSIPERCINLNQITINYLNDGITDNNKWTSLKERFKIMVSHYGIPTTVWRHFLFIFRALRRRKI